MLRVSQSDLSTVVQFVMVTYGCKYTVAVAVAVASHWGGTGKRQNFAACLKEDDWVGVNEKSERL